ncbi:hypothetical protein [Pedobacter frigoris]|uniref:hypothetical protein n=1 Tax=Pedobacter frigoris TaxID=2571272 RepID=UPI00145D73E8|nr:hypothetical protein [Pedobacter frigoris]
MFKFLIVIFILVLALIYFGNYLDYKKQRINKKEYDRRVRLFIALILIIIALLVWLKKR